MRIAKILLLLLSLFMTFTGTAFSSEFFRLRDTFGDWKVRHVYNEQNLQHRFSDAKTFMTLGQHGKLPAQINRTSEGYFHFRFKYGIGTFQDLGIFGVGNWVTNITIKIGDKTFSYKGSARLQVHEFVTKVDHIFLKTLADAKTPASVRIFVNNKFAVTASLPVNGSSAALRWLRVFEDKPPTSSTDLQIGKKDVGPSDAMTSQELEGEWEIDTFGESVVLSHTGLITHGDRLSFIFEKENCEKVIYIFSVYTLETVEFGKLTGSTFPIEFNGEKTGAKLDAVRKAMSGQLLHFYLGRFGKNALLDRLINYERIKIRFLDGKKYKASDYFDIPFNEWITSGISDAFEDAYQVCTQKKV